MASNALPDQIDQLLTLAEDMEDGLATYGAAIGIQQNTQPVMKAARLALSSAQNDFFTSRSAKKALVTAQTVADSNAKAYIATARGILANYLGSAWSQAWEAAGFLNGSLAMPPTVAERQAQLTPFAAYFTANPTHEAPPLVTAARATALEKALSSARAAVNGAATLISQNKSSRDAADTALRARMRGLIAELRQLIGDADPRWYAFGLNAPADPNTPGIPDGLVLTLGAAGVVYADWADARRAERYRVWKKVAGVDTEFIAAASVTDSDATLTGLPSGATVEFRVTALNDAGESQPGATVSVVMP